MKGYIEFVCIALLSTVSFGLCLNTGSNLTVHLDLVDTGYKATNVPSPKIVFVGTVEGKSYFYDKTVSFNWTGAKAHCNAAGLQLATITTAAQQTFLKNAHGSSLPGGNYWTGGRESRKFSMFAWDSSGDELPSIYSGSPGHGLTTYYVCLYAYGGGDLRAAACTGITYVLCETMQSDEFSNLQLHPA